APGTLSYREIRPWLEVLFWFLKQEMATNENFRLDVFGNDGSVCHGCSCPGPAQGSGVVFLWQGNCRRIGSRLDDHWGGHRFRQDRGLGTGKHGPATGNRWPGANRHADHCRTSRRGHLLQPRGVYLDGPECPWLTDSCPSGITAWVCILG